MNLQQVLDELNLTPYGASQIIGAETDEPLTTIQMRWSRWLKRTPESVSVIERDLSLLGYTIKIEREESMSLPQYFQPGETDNEFYHSVGEGRIYGTLTVKGCEVKYRFNDGNKPYTEVRTFDTQKAAEAFATKFAAEMNRCDKRASVPVPATFRDF